MAEWSQTVLRPENATELAALAMKHAIVNRDVAHLIFPDEVQELEGVAEPPPRPMTGRVAAAEHRAAGKPSSSAPLRCSPTPSGR